MIKTPLSTVIGGAFWTPDCTIIGGNTQSFAQLIKSLFANNEQGFAYDPNDLTTMFQDAAGTVPVTAVGKPVGLVLDKSKGLAVGPELVDLSKWVARANTAITVTGNKVRFTAIADGAWGADLNYTSPTISGKRYKVLFNLVTGDLTSSVFARFTTGSALTYGAGTHTLVELSTGAPQAAIALTTGKAGAYVEVELSVVELPGNHAYQTTSAARPILRQNATTGAYYLEFDGTDDFLQTSNIDFTSTDKVSLFTGLRKLRDSPVESILELGVLPYDGVGTFWISSNALAPNDVWIAIAQSWNARTGFSKVAPVANNFVVSARLDFAGSVATDEVKPRLNGSTVGFTRGLLEHAGTGNFGSHPMYIGSRAGPTLPFNGHLYSLIGVGRLTTDNETTALEELIAKYTGVTLSV